MNIGIIGTEQVGITLGELFTKGMHKVMFTSRHYKNQKILGIEDKTNALYGSLEETFSFADVHLLAVPFLEIPNLVEEIKEYAKAKVLIDPTIPCSQGEYLLKQKGYSINQSNAYIESLLPNSFVAKAFDSCSHELLKQQAFRVIDQEKLMIPFTCRNPEVKQILENLIMHLGFLPVFIDRPYSIKAVKELLRYSSKQ